MDWDFSNVKRKETTKLSHGYHTYPAKFIPQLAEKLIDNFTSDKVYMINDPFMGCGTTAISALIKGHKIIGTDINKFAVLLTKVKSKPIEPKKLRLHLEKLYKKIDNIENVSPTIPIYHIERIKYWFCDENIKKIGKLITIINKEKDQDIQDFLKIGLSNTLKLCSRWLQRSTKPTIDKNKKVNNPYSAIKKQLDKMELGNSELYITLPDYVRNNFNDYFRIECADAKNQAVRDNSIDLIITSSPYVTSYDYADIHQLSILWLDLVDDFKKHKSQYIGSPVRVVCTNTSLTKTGKEIVTLLDNKSKSHARKVKAFFLDMCNVIKESFRILKFGGLACYVIGNTTIKGVKIDNKKVFLEIMNSLGFNCSVIERKISSKMLPTIRDKNGKFASIHSKDTKKIYHKEYIILARKHGSK